MAADRCRDRRRNRVCPGRRAARVRREHVRALRHFVARRPPFQGTPGISRVRARGRRVVLRRPRYAPPGHAAAGRSGARCACHADGRSATADAGSAGRAAFHLQHARQYQAAHPHRAGVRPPHGGGSRPTCARRCRKCAARRRHSARSRACAYLVKRCMGRRSWVATFASVSADDALVERDQARLNPAIEGGTSARVSRGWLRGHRLRTHQTKGSGVGRTCGRHRDRTVARRASPLPRMCRMAWWRRSKCHSPESAPGRATDGFAVRSH